MVHFCSSVSPAAEGVCGDLPGGGRWAGTAGLGCHSCLESVVPGGQQLLPQLSALDFC